MTLKGKVIMVLTFLVALIASAGVTVFGGLQLGHGELDSISAEAETLDVSTLPFLVAAQNLKLEADRLAQGADRESGDFDRTLGVARDLAKLFCRSSRSTLYRLKDV